MPALAPYIPVRNAALIAWMNNFSSLISAAPATYGLMASDATTIAAQKTALAAAYALITSGSTKTAATVSAFNTAKINALAVARPYAQTVSLNAGVSSANKIALGVNPRTSVPLPITAPTTFPTLTIQSSSTAGTIIRYRDSVASPSVKAKPYGVVQMQLYYKQSTTPVTDPTTLAILGSFTKSPIQVTTTGVTPGGTVYFAARWITKKGLLGPWSPIVQYVVVA